MKNTAINWPAILSYVGDNELAYIADQSEWDLDSNWHCFDYQSNDLLIDSQGIAYSLSHRKNSLVVPEPTQQTLSLEQVSELIKAHLSAQGSCCVTKFFASSIKEAIAMLASSYQK